MRVRLNLATKPIESHRRFLAGSGLAAFVAVILLIYLSWHVHSVRSAATEVRARTAAMDKDLQQYKAERDDLEKFFGRKDIASLNARASFLNGIIDARSFNWTRMFMDLEQILPAGVRVISIEPKQYAGHAELKLTVGATSDEAKLKLLHALEQSKQFSDVQEVREYTPSQGNSNTLGDQKIILMTTSYLGS